MGHTHGEPDATRSSDHPLQNIDTVEGNTVDFDLFLDCARLDEFTYEGTVVERGPSYLDRLE